LKNQQNKMILQNNIRLFLYFFSISLFFDFEPISPDNLELTFPFLNVNLIFTPPV